MNFFKAHTLKNSFKTLKSLIKYTIISLLNFSLLNIIKNNYFLSLSKLSNRINKKLKVKFC